MAIEIRHFQKKVNYQLMYIPMACLFTRVYLYLHVNMKYLFQYQKKLVETGVQRYFFETTENYVNSTPFHVIISTGSRGLFHHDVSKLRPKLMQVTICFSPLGLSRVVMLKNLGKWFHRPLPFEGLEFHMRRILDQAEKVFKRFQG